MEIPSTAVLLFAWLKNPRYAPVFIELTNWQVKQRTDLCRAQTFQAYLLLQLKLKALMITPSKILKKSGLIQGSSVMVRNSRYIRTKNSSNEPNDAQKQTKACLFGKTMNYLREISLNCITTFFESTDWLALSQRWLSERGASSRGLSSVAVLPTWRFQICYWLIFFSMFLFITSGILLKQRKKLFPI